LQAARVAEIADKGADDPALVDAMVLEEALVFSGNECFLHHIRNG
jgi:hypothetical protein